MMKSQLRGYIFYYAKMNVFLLLEKLFTSYFTIDLY